MLLLTGGCVAASAFPASAQSESVIRFATLGIEEGALPYYAQEKGFFKQAGLNVELSIFPNGGSVTQGLAGGSIDLGMSNTGSMVLGHGRGLPISVVACGALYSNAAPIAHLVVNPLLGIRNAKQLSGKTVAVSSLREMLQASVMLWIDKNGGDSKSVNFIEMPASAQPAAVEAKRIDGGSLVEPFYSRFKDDVRELGHPYQAVADGKPFQTLGTIARKSWIEANPTLGQRVATALHETARWANRNHDEAARLLAKLTKIDAVVIERIPRIAFAESNNPALLQPVVDLMMRYQLLAKAFPASDLFARAVM
jgi:NitT/TauT family transport system substrate-binding protein